MIVSESFYLDHDVLALARALIGKLLVTEMDGLRTSGIIVETEAYRAPEDRASHAYGNRLTERTKTMFMSGGHSYVYLCYGVHELFNVVTATEGVPHAVLIRAVEPLQGLEIMFERRSLSEKQKYLLTRGPGSLSKALGIDRSFNATPLYREDSAVRIEDIGIRFAQDEIASSKRIGVENAGESALWPWRYYVKSNPYVSGKKDLS